MSIVANIMLWIFPTLLALALDSAFTALERSQMPQVRRA